MKVLNKSTNTERTINTTFGEIVYNEMELVIARDILTQSLQLAPRRNVIRSERHYEVTALAPRKTRSKFGTHRGFKFEARWGEDGEPYRVFEDGSVQRAAEIG